MKPLDNGQETDRDSMGRFTEGNKMGAGRPAGSRNKATIAAEVLLDGQAQGLTQKAVEIALEGDTAALRLCLERILPVLKDRPVLFDLPADENGLDARAAIEDILKQVAAGNMTPAEASAVISLLHKSGEAHRKVQSLNKDMFY